MSLKSFRPRDLAESLGSVNLCAQSVLHRRVLCKEEPLGEVRQQTVSCASSQGLVEEATGNQLCRRQGFPYGFGYNPFPLTNCWVREVQFVANECWRKGFYLGRLCISSRAGEKGRVLLHVLRLEKRICTAVKIPAGSLDDAD